MNETQAAISIQKAWRSFASDRRNVVSESRGIALRIGHRIRGWHDFYRYQRQNRIVLVFNGNAENPMVGHSYFALQNVLWSLVLGPRREISARVAGAFSRYPVGADRPHAGEFAGIVSGRESVPDMTIFREKIEYLGTKGNLFVLDAIYTRFFRQAFYAEVGQFTAMPYSYGLHYNCNTLVRNVLRRLVQLAAESPAPRAQQPRVYTDADALSVLMG